MFENNKQFNWGQTLFRNTTWYTRFIQTFYEILWSDITRKLFPNQRKYLNSLCQIVKPPVLCI